MKNPPKCVGGNLRIISCQYFIISLLLALLLNTSLSFTLPCIICLVFYSCDTQPIGDQHGEQQQESSPPSGVLGNGPSRLVSSRGSSLCLR
jgi:hypothetical protein